MVSQVLDEVKLKPIGYVYTDASDEEVKNSYMGVDGYIEVLPEYAEGLDGIEGFSHIILISYPHKTTKEQRRVLKVKPRRLLRFGIRIDDIPYVGVFLSDSPHRPNPIGLSIVEVVERKGNRVYVRGLDLFNGTPILDIKAYTPDRCIENPRVPGWMKKLEERIREKFGEIKYI